MSNEPAVPTTRRRRIWSALAAALGFALWRWLAGDTPLSLVLLTLPLLAWVLPWRAVVPWLIAGCLLSLAFDLQQITSEQSVVWWPTLVHIWGGAGAAVALALVIQPLARLSRVWQRMAALLIVALIATVVVLPLRRIYRVQLVTRHPDAVFAGGEHWMLEGSDGVKLACRWSAPPAFRGVVVFTHGVGGSYDQFVGIHQLFAAQGFAVLDWHLRGHGRSSVTATTYGRSEAADLRLVWAEAQRRAAGKPLVAYGASLGGATTLLAAPELPALRGLVIESSYADFASLVGRSLPGPAAACARVIAWAGLGLNLDDLRPIDALPRLQSIPLLLGTALEDQIVPPEHGWRLAAAAPWATHLALSDWGHMDLAYDARWRGAVAQVLEAAASAQ